MICLEFNNNNNRDTAVTVAERRIMYYKFNEHKRNIENEEYSIEVFDRKQRDYYTKQYLHYIKVGIFDRFTVTSCYDANAIKNVTEFKY